MAAGRRLAATHVNGMPFKTPDQILSHFFWNQTQNKWISIDKEALTPFSQTIDSKKN
jgi:hypothetical protein